MVKPIFHNCENESDLCFNHNCQRNFHCINHVNLRSKFTSSENSKKKNASDFWSDTQDHWLQEHLSHFFSNSNSRYHSESSTIFLDFFCQGLRDRSLFMCACVGGKNHGVGQAYFLEKRGGPKENFTMIGGG